MRRADCPVPHGFGPARSRDDFNFIEAITETNGGSSPGVILKGNSDPDLCVDSGLWSY